MVTSSQFPKCTAELQYGSLHIKSAEMDCNSLLDFLQKMQDKPQNSELNGKVSIYFNPEDKYTSEFDRLASLSIKILKEMANDGC